MVITETVTLNNKEFVHNYSDEKFYIRKVGTNEVYSEAYDLPEKGYKYEETQEKIEDESSINRGH